MTKTAIISIDLATLAGTVRFQPGNPLPRRDTRELELVVATTFLAHLSQCEASTFSDVQSNPVDPPDVTFLYQGEFRGLELSELAPERYEKDSILRKLRRDITSELVLGEHTQGFVVTITFVDNYATKLRPGRIHSVLAAALREFFQHRGANREVRIAADQFITIEVPSELQHIVTGISAFRADLTNDPRLEDEREPLIVFPAQSTMLIPEDDCPKIVESRLSRKGLHDLAHPTWLLLWSNHHALESLRDELDNAIGYYLRRHPMNYERIYHLHLFSGSGATLFPSQKAHDCKGTCDDGGQ